jgi:hypothetical protein
VQPLEGALRRVGVGEDEEPVDERRDGAEQPKIGAVVDGDNDLVGGRT